MSKKNSSKMKMLIWPNWMMVKILMKMKIWIWMIKTNREIMRTKLTNKITSKMNQIKINKTLTNNNKPIITTR